MSKKDMRYVNAKSMTDELQRNNNSSNYEQNDPAISEQREYRKNIAYTTQDIVDKLDQQKLRDIELEFMRKATREELEDSIRKLDNHAICSGNVMCPKDIPTVVVKEERKCNGCTPSEKVVNSDPVAPIILEKSVEEVHGPDCHCSKCCPNPNPTWFQKHKYKLLAAIVFLCVLILSIGWLPSGGSYEALQKAYVELIVSLPKMVLLSVAGFAIFKIAKSVDEKEKK